MAAPSVLASPAVAVRNLRKAYAKTVAVDSVGFTVPYGSLYGLIGPDGGGKSTVLKSIAGVLAYDAGAVEVFGILLDSERAGERIKERIGFMPQGLGLNLYPELSVEENIDFFARLRLVPPEAYAERKRRLLETTRLHLYLDRPMKNLSGGMKQKLGLVCSLIHDPQLLILDEPTTGVDPVSRRDFWTILSDLVRASGVTAIVSSAYTDEASRFDAVCLMHGGRVLADASPEEIAKEVRGRFVSVVAQPELVALERLRTAFGNGDAIGDRIRVRLPDDTPDVRPAIEAALEDLPAISVQEEPPTLEDAFAAMIGEPPTAAPSGLLAPTTPSVPTASNRVVVAEGLTRQFGAFRAADRVSFEIGAGEIFGLLGANGAGKTTVIKMLTGILQPTAGRAEVAGVDMRRAGNAVKRRIGYVSQAFSLYQDLTVAENVRLYAGIYGLLGPRMAERTQWVLRYTGLDPHADARSGSLPMGLRQRLALGCALVHEPRVLFLDEPTSGVDPLGRRMMWELLFRLAKEQGVAILVTTHYMPEAEHCDRVALMHASRVVANDSPKALREQLRREVGGILQVSCAAPEAARLALVEAGYAPAFYGRDLRVVASDPLAASQDLARLMAAQGLADAAVEECEPTMEDVFVTRITALEREAEAARR
jgi:ABC-2 type transport system ATP-binding protein